MKLLLPGEMKYIDYVRLVYKPNIVEVPKVCPECGSSVLINKYDAECSDFDNCEWIMDIPEDYEIKRV